VCLFRALTDVTCVQYKTLMQGATAPDTRMRSVADAKAKWGGSGGTGKATVLSDIRKRVRFVR